MKGSLEQLRPSQASFIGKAHKGKDEQPAKPCILIEFRLKSKPC